MAAAGEYPSALHFYELHDEIGRAAGPVLASVTYRATCVPRREVVAVKVFDLEQDTAGVEHLTNEVNRWKELRHDNIVELHTTFNNDHHLYVVTQLHDMGSAIDVIRAGFPDGFGELDACAILREVLQGIEYLHKQGKMHRNLKAENIMLHSTGAVRIADFSLSQTLLEVEAAEGGATRRARRSPSSAPRRAPRTRAGR